MSERHQRPLRWSWLASVLAVVALGLGFATVPAAAAPIRPLPLDPAAIVTPQIVNINTKFGYNAAIGAGTGIVIDPNGVVLTNNHVISSATDISAVDVGNGQSYAVDVIGYDRTADIAVLQLHDASGLQTATLGTSSNASVGEQVVGIGNAGGTGGTGATGAAGSNGIDGADGANGGAQGGNGLAGTNGDNGHAGGPGGAGGNGGVGEGGQDRGTAQAVGVAIARRTPHQPAGQPGQRQAQDVAQVVAGVGEQRERLGHPAPRRLGRYDAAVQNAADREGGPEAGRRMVVMAVAMPMVAVVMSAHGGMVVTMIVMNMVVVVVVVVGVGHGRHGWRRRFARA